LHASLQNVYDHAPGGTKAGVDRPNRVRISGYFDKTDLVAQLVRVAIWAAMYDEHLAVLRAVSQHRDERILKSLDISQKGYNDREPTHE